MQDFEEGFAIGYLLGKKKYSKAGSADAEHYDPIFHDILENSEAFCTVIVDDVYKFTFNLWVSHRGDVAYGKRHNYGNYTAVETEGVGYSQSPILYTYFVHTVKILWKNDQPMYAVMQEHDSMPYSSIGYVDVHESLDKPLPYKYYFYIQDSYEYIKGSTVSSTDSNSQLYIKPFFKNGSDGTKYLDLESAGVVDSNGNPAYIGCQYKIKCTYYTTVPYECEWTDPNNGETYTVNDRTKPPKIVLEKEKEIIKTIGGCNLYLLACDSSWSNSIHSDLPEKQLNGLTDELIKAICEKYGDETCYTHVAAEWLTPEEEET